MGEWPGPRGRDTAAGRWSHQSLGLNELAVHSPTGALGATYVIQLLLVNTSKAKALFPSAERIIHQWRGEATRYHRAHHPLYTLRALKRLYLDNVTPILLFPGDSDFTKRSGNRLDIGGRHQAMEWGWGIDGSSLGSLRSTSFSPSEDGTKW